MAQDCWSVGLVCATRYSWTTGPHWEAMEPSQTVAETEGSTTPNTGQVVAELYDFLRAGHRPAPAPRVRAAGPHLPAPSPWVEPRGPHRHRECWSRAAPAVEVLAPCVVWVRSVCVI